MDKTIVIIVMAVTGIMFLNCLGWSMKAKSKVYKSLLLLAGVAFAITCMEMISKLVVINSGSDINETFVKVITTLMLIIQIIFGILGFLISLLTFLSKDKKPESEFKVLH